MAFIIPTWVIKLFSSDFRDPEYQARVSAFRRWAFFAVSAASLLPFLAAEGERLFVQIFAYFALNALMWGVGRNYLPKYNFAGYYKEIQRDKKTFIYAKGFLGAINVQQCFKEARSPIQPKIKVDRRGNALINATNTTLTADAIIANLPAIQNKAGCRIVTCYATQDIGQIRAVFTARNWPEKMYWDDYVSFERETFIPFGYNMVGLTGWDMDIHPHLLLAGKSGMGKTNEMMVLITSILYANPNAIIIIGELAKQGSDFMNVSQRASHLEEFWAGTRKECDVEKNQNIILTTDENVLARLVMEVHRIKLERDAMRGHIMARVTDMRKLAGKPFYQTDQGYDVLPPPIFFMVDEGKAAANVLFAGATKNGENYFTQTRKLFSIIIQTGRSSEIHVVLSVLGARFETLGEDRDQFYRTSLFSEQSEIRIALGREFDIPPIKGMYAYHVERGIALSKALLVDDDFLLPSKQAEIAWAQSNGESKRTAMRLHEVAEQVVSEEDRRNVQNDLRNNARVPIIGAGKDITPEPSTIVYGTSEIE